MELAANYFLLVTSTKLEELILVAMHYGMYNVCTRKLQHSNALVQLVYGMGRSSQHQYAGACGSTLWILRIDTPHRYSLNHTPSES